MATQAVMDWTLSLSQRDGSGYSESFDGNSPPDHVGREPPSTSWEGFKYKTPPVEAETLPSTEHEFPPPTPPSSIFCFESPQNFNSSLSNMTELQSGVHLRSAAFRDLTISSLSPSWASYDETTFRRHVQDELNAKRGFRCCSFDNFLHYVLQYQSDKWDEIIEKVAAEVMGDYSSIRDNYIKERFEDKRYPIYLKLRNRVIDEVNKHSPPQSQTCKWLLTSRHLLHGAAKTKPDISAVSVSFNKSLPSSWDDVCFFEEFKVDTDSIIAKSSSSSEPSVKSGDKRLRDESDTFGSKMPRVDDDQREASRAVETKEGWRRLTINHAQAAGYGIEMMNFFCRRKYSAGTYMSDGLCMLIYLDRGGALASEIFHVLSSPGRAERDGVTEEEQCKRFVALTIAFSFAPPAALGHDVGWIRKPSTTPNPSLSVPLTSSSSSSSSSLNSRTHVFFSQHDPGVCKDWTRRLGDYEVTVKEMVDRREHFGLISQAPKVLIASTKWVGQGNPSSPKWPGEVIIKMSWHPKTQPSEAGMIQHAGISGLPTILGTFTSDSLSELPRGKIMGLSNENLGEDRQLTFQVMPRYTPLFTLLKDSKDHLMSIPREEIPKVFKELVRIHHELHERGILHRDVSIGNLFAKSGAAGYEGILLDLNRAIYTNGPPNSSGDVSQQRLVRTGTLPFMAIDLLNSSISPSPQHRYEYDLESFFWVLVWIFAEEQRERQVKGEAPAGSQAKEKSVTSESTDTEGAEPRENIQWLYKMFRCRDRREFYDQKSLFLSAKYTEALTEIFNNTKLPKVLLRWVFSLRDRYAPLHKKQTSDLSEGSWARMESGTAPTCEPIVHLDYDTFFNTLQ